MTRNEYLDANTTAADTFALHRAYYAQYVMQAARSMVGVRFGLPLLKETFAADKHLNGIPLAAWDRLGFPPVDRSKLKANGDSLSLANAVCVWKEAARQLVESFDA